jgi:hypothetical protein
MMNVENITKDSDFQVDLLESDDADHSPKFEGELLFFQTLANPNQFNYLIRRFNLRIMASKSMQRAGPQLPPVAKYTIGIVGAISVIVFLYATHHHDMWMRQITKPWPVVGLILLVAEATFLVPHRTNISILAALVFCLLGSYNFALPTLLQFGAPPNVCKRNFFFFLGSVFPPALTF